MYRTAVVTGTLLIVFSLSRGSFAGQVANVPVTSVLIQIPGSIGAGIAFIYFDTTRSSHTGTWSCSPGASYRFVVDLGTPAGRAAFAVALSAYQNKTTALVSIVGTGDCLLWSDTETVSYIQVF